MAEPLVGAGERAGIEAADMGPSADLAADEAGMFQHFDMLGRAGEADRERLRQLAHRALSVGKMAEHPAPRGVAEGVEHQIQSGRIKINHVVEYASVKDDCQPIG